MKNYNVVCIEKDILIPTGKGDNILWNKAEILTDFVSPWENEKFEKIEFKALWDTKNLFFCFTVYDNNVHIDNKDNSIDSIGKSDRVELFFRINKSLDPYYCLEIDPSPRIMDFKAHPDKQFEFEWNWPKKDLTVKSQIDDNKFTVEIAISIASLKKLNLIRNNKIETGIFRAKYKEVKNSIFEPTWIAWVNPNTISPNFHTSTAFGNLKLMNS